MKLDANFVSSAFELTGCPKWNFHEVAIAGRSNVGKSSLINAVTGRKNLARTSKTPGRTRCLNFFKTSKHLALVDLPGYGYAKVPRAEAEIIAKMMRDYLTQRENLDALVLLIDSRRGPGDWDFELARITALREVELIVVATKSDKLRNSERRAALERFEPLEVTPIMCSVETGVGIDDLRRRILGLVNRVETLAARPGVRGAAS